MDTQEPVLDNAANAGLEQNSQAHDEQINEVKSNQEESSDKETEAPVAGQFETVGGEDPEAAAEDEQEEAEKAPAVTYATMAEVVAAAAELLDRDASLITREELNRLRQQFALLYKSVIEADKAKFVEEGGDPEAYHTEDLPEEVEFRNILAKIKDKKAAYIAALEAEREANLARKNEIIDKINALAEDTDNVNRTFPTYRELQDEFNAIGEVPAPEETGVWKRFQEAREHFSDNLKINKELRDYDFKKNLEQKELLISEAAKLNAEDDVITAFKRLQELHNKWREIGPVAKELREEIWAKFKDASLEINKRYQEHFEERKRREAENEAGKIAICERVEALDFSKLDSFNAWEKMTETIKEAQDDWKKLGFASRKMNNALFARFRATCDTFFAIKAAYYKSVKDEFARNLAAKTALADEAEALKDSTDWKKTTDRLVAMQKEWKTIGAVAKKYSDAVWHRFQSACDHFFEQKKAATSGQRQTEQANLQAKRDLIDELDKITAETDKEEARNLINDLRERWKMVGHVPFREKDKIYEVFRNRINEVREKFDLADRRGRMERFENSVNELEGDKLYRERERQLRLLDTRRAELRTYENNLGFLSTKSKDGNSLVRDFERKIERLKADIAALEEKVRLIDSKL